jgi:hypothetical protein
MPRDLHPAAHPYRIVPLDVVHEAVKCSPRSSNSRSTRQKPARLPYSKRSSTMRLRPAIEFGDACPKRGVFRNQSVDPRYQRDNQRFSQRPKQSFTISVHGPP